MDRSSQDCLEGFGKGSRVWFRTDDKRWELATLQSIAGSACALALDSPLGEGTGKVFTAPIDTIVPANPPLLELVPDLTSLSFLNDPSILHTLHQRYKRDVIYTHAGPVLVAVNPFKQVDLYSPSHVQVYVDRPAGGTKAASEDYAPHIFLTADKAFKQMVHNKVSQSILITGESGAGKTETTKFVMKYLAGLSGGSGMEDKILQTNPILEAFGNAKTIHNNNSSRFGKLIEIYFSRSKAICGALIQTYLLEKSRVVHQLPGERNYHVFYQLCKGATHAERASLLLPSSLQTFDYLNQSGCLEIAGVDDVKEFAQLKDALAAVGIGAERQHRIWRILSAILWLGNIQFEVSPHNSDAVNISGGITNKALVTAATLLGVDAESLAIALTRRRMKAGGENITKELSKGSAEETRDALAKAIYESLFRWLVHQINSAISIGKERAETSLCILDIYGFECFAENSFEQLCINFANERLQQQFAAHLFKLEQAVYDEEGIDWEKVDFEDNQECVDLIESRPPGMVGLLSLLDEECMFPKGSDATFAAKLHQRLKDQPRFSFNTKCPGLDFTLHHYAGPVNYCTTKFLDKNRDTLSPDLVNILENSSDDLVMEIAGELKIGQDRSKSQTVGARFRDQLRDLIGRLDRTELHFVRCIKPNGKQQASNFDQGLIHHQLRCCGVLEVARIAQAGYPTRYAHTDFVYRYRLLLPGMPQGPLPAGLSPLDICKRLLSHLGVDPSLYQIGRTKLFFRAGVLGRLEDRVIRINKAVLVIQSTWRMAVQQRKFLKVKAAATLIEATWRGCLGRRKAAEQRRQRNAAIFIQSVWRSYATRQEYRVTREAVVYIQHCWRRLQARRELRARLVLRQEEERSAAEQAAIRFSEQESYEALKQEFGVDGAYIREVLTVWRQHGERFQEYLESIEGAECTEGADAEQRFEPNETLKLYVAELEEEVEELRSQLQAQVQAQLHQASLEEHLQHRSIETDRSHYSDTSVSIMSYSNDESVSPIQTKRHNKQTDQPGTTIDIAATAVSAEAIGPRPAIPTVRFGRAGPEGAVAALQAEMAKKSALFDDDASFIREVHEGVSLAPSMNPREEIDRLIYRYKAWQRDFKARLKSTQETLRRSQYSSEYHHRASSSRAPTSQHSLQDGKASPRFNEGGLTARLMTFARGSRQRLVNTMSQ